MTVLLSSLPLLSALLCLALAAFVLSRNPKNPANLSFALGMLALTVMEGGPWIARSLVEMDEISWYEISLAGAVFLPVPWLVFSLTFGRSDPAGVIRKWRYGIFLTALASLTFLIVLVSGMFLTDALTLRLPGYWFAVFLFLSLTVALANLEGTWRSASEIQRWRIKFMLVGVGSILVFLLYILSQALLFSAVSPDLSPMTSSAIVIGCSLIAFSLLRHRLMEVDIFVSRYVVYNSITVITAGLYLVVIGLTAQALKSSGDVFDSYLGALFVFLSILFMVMLLFSYNVRKRVKTFVDRNFYKNKYDYRKEWQELADRLSAKLNIQDLLPPLQKMFFETFWIKQVTLWLYEEQDQVFHPVRAEGEKSLTTIQIDPGTRQRLIDRDYPVPLDPEGSGRQDSSWFQNREGATLRSLGIRRIIPLVINRELIGFMGVSESQSGKPIDTEDCDLMKMVGKQAASCFLSAKLSKNLVSAKEMETFHAFSTFVIHDLKNFVSMLSLLTRNMERNFENPVFRKEALESMTQTVDKMQRMMDRLAALSQFPQLSLHKSDLNDVVQEALREVRPSVKSLITEEYQKIPIVVTDRSQMKRVITNLILNADEAIDHQGEIRLKTFVQNGQVILAVSDNGKGMAREFLEKSLFKPFSTTKSHGFGIGLYQCKRIVEGFGGMIQVQSEVGKGSVFRISIPVSGE